MNRVEFTMKSFLIALLFVGQACAQVSRPAAGIDVDETRTINVSTRLPQPCISLVLGQVTVSLPEQSLQSMAAARPVRWTNEAERLALIRGERATALLNAASTASTDGCRRMTQPLTSDAQHLVAQMLEAGEATVRVGVDEPLLQIKVHYYGRRCGPACGRGQISFSVPPSRTFFVLSWWVS